MAIQFFGDADDEQTEPEHNHKHVHASSSASDGVPQFNAREADSPMEREALEIANQSMRLVEDALEAFKAFMENPGEATARAYHEKLHAMGDAPDKVRTTLMGLLVTLYRQIKG